MISWDHCPSDGARLPLPHGDALVLPGKLMLRSVLVLPLLLLFVGCSSSQLPATGYSPGAGATTQDRYHPKAFQQYFGGGR